MGPPTLGGPAANAARPSTSARTTSASPRVPSPRLRHPADDLRLPNRSPLCVGDQRGQSVAVDIVAARHLVDREIPIAVIGRLVVEQKLQGRLGVAVEPRAQAEQLLPRQEGSERRGAGTCRGANEPAQGADVVAMGSGREQGRLLSGSVREPRTAITPPNVVTFPVFGIDLAVTTGATLTTP